VAASPSFTVTSVSATSTALPSAVTLSCHAFTLYLPGGRPVMRNFPFASVAQKNGWSRTNTQAFIHEWTSHWTGIAASFDLKGSALTPPAICATFVWPFVSECTWTLCVVWSLFLTVRDCP